MNLARVLVASIVILGLSTSAFAGDLAESIAKAVQEQTPREQARPPKIPKSYLVPGATLFVVGMGMVVYGFLHTSGGEFVSGSVSTESKTEIGGAGLAVAGAGGAILLLGAHQAKHAPSVMIGPNHFSIAKRIVW